MDLVQAISNRPSSKAALFNVDLPSWWRDIKVEAHSKVAANPMTLGCRTGNPVYLRAFLLGFWPFVHIFPDVIRQGLTKLARSGEVARTTKFLTRASGILAGIENDERSHRTMFLDTAQAVGLSMADFTAAKCLPLVQALFTRIIDSPCPASMFLRFAAVEVEAEAFSEELLSSEPFRLGLPPQSLRWFHEHQQHDATPHEALAYNLATACHHEPLHRDYVEPIAFEMIALFSACAEASVKAHVPWHDRLNFMGY
jgi:pyrroloquinoline quinone (PQQ) biosynthesis protein C